MSFLQNSPALSGRIQELSFDEISYVSGGSIDAPADEPWLLGKGKQDVDSGRTGDYLSSVVSAICGFFAKSVKQAGVCAVAGEAAKDFADGMAKYPPTDPMDTKLGINTGK